MLKSSKKLFLVIALIPLLMFAFAFAMVPLYGWYCEVAGINQIQSAERLSDAESRDLAEIQKQLNAKEAVAGQKIKVEFDATLHGSVEGLVSQFRSLTPSIRLKPGEVHNLSYVVKNISSEPLVTQAVPSITPWWGTEHFKKIECFCFQQQTLAPGEQKEMGLQFYIHPDIPNDIKTLTLSYTLMSVVDVERTAGIKKINSY